MLVDGGSSDIEAFAAPLPPGPARAARLLHAASVLGRTSADGRAALRLAACDLKEHTWDTARYADAASASGTQPDTAWMATTDAAAAEAAAAANAALSAAQAAIDRAGIRAGHAALGDAALRRGDAPGALRAHGRARDYCGSPAQVAETAVAAAVAAAASGAWPTVAAHAGKAEAAAGGGGGGPGGAAVPSPLLAAAAAGSASSAFDARKYRAAALKFAAVGADLGDAIAAQPALAWLGSPADVALLGGLAGAACLEWGELNTVLLASPSFRDHLDVRPDVRAMLDHLASGRFGPALAALRVLAATGPAARLDARLSAHGPALLAAARARILTQYTRPYASLRLEPAAVDLGMDVDTLEDELAALIRAGRVPARLDADARILLARRPPGRRSALAAAAAAGDAFAADAGAVLLRGALLRAGLVGRPPASGQRRGGGGSGGGRPDRRGEAEPPAVEGARG